MYDPSGPNMSEPTYAAEIEPKTGKEIFTIVKSANQSRSPDKKNM